MGKGGGGDGGSESINKGSCALFSLGVVEASRVDGSFEGGGEVLVLCGLLGLLLGQADVLEECDQVLGHGCVFVSVD